VPVEDVPFDAPLAAFDVEEPVLPVLAVLPLETEPEPDVGVPTRGVITSGSEELHARTTSDPAVRSATSGERRGRLGIMSTHSAK
jgi:hypothetical protein